MAETYKKLGQALLTTANATTMYTCPSSTSTIVKHMRFTSVDASNTCHIKIYHLDSGETAGDAGTQILAETTILANGWAEFEGTIILEWNGVNVMPWSFFDSNGNQLTKQRGTLAIADGGTGAITAAAALEALGAGLTDNPTFATAIASTAFLPDAADGATLGTAALEFSDLFLADGAVINLGADQDVTFTHVHNAGVLLNSTSKIQFGDSGTFIHQSSNGVLTITSDTTVDINGAVVFDGALTGATAITSTGVITGLTIEATGDTATSDNAAIGYTAAEGLILTGQGSTNDVTIKNDADATVISIPTGTTGVTFAGTVGSGAITSTGVVTATGFTIGSAAITEAELELLDGATSLGVGLGLVIALLRSTPAL